MRKRQMKKFLVIGNLNAISYKEIFPLIKENKLWFGVRPATGGMWFTIDDETSCGTKKVVDGKLLGNTKSIWFTNLDNSKRHSPITLTQTYSSGKYPKYDNYNAIEVSRTKDIPMDYDGVMGVPISFLDKYCPEQFEILGCTQRGCHDLVPDTKKYDDFIEMKPDGTPTGSKGGKTNENANLKGNDGKKNYFINKDDYMVQSLYGRIFIRFKNV